MRARAGGSRGAPWWLVTLAGVGGASAAPSAAGAVDASTVGPCGRLRPACHCQTAAMAAAAAQVTAQAAVAFDGGVADVAISGFAFHAPDVTVTPGTTVRWTNQDGVEHSVTSQAARGLLQPDGTWDSGLLEPAASFSFRFDRPGDYYYYCQPHGSSMQAVVHVVPEPAAVAALCAVVSLLARRCGRRHVPKAVSR